MATSFSSNFSNMCVAVYFGEMRRETAPHFFGLWAGCKKRSGQVISRRKARNEWTQSVASLCVPTLTWHVSHVRPSVRSCLSRVAMKIFEDFQAHQTVIATTAHWGITVNLGSWFLSLLLWQIDSPISKVSHGALLTYSSFCQALCPFCVHV